MVTHPSGPVHFGLRTPFKGCEAQMPTITMLVQSGGKSVYPARKLFSFFRFANDLSVALQKLQEDYLSSDWSSLLQTA
jgi:hypothetical protein